MSIPAEDKRLLPAEEIAAAGLSDWEQADGELVARFRTGSFSTGMRLLHQIAEEAERVQHHPDVELTYPRLVVHWSSHDVGGLTMRDVRMARVVSEQARALGISPEPHG